MSSKAIHILDSTDKTEGETYENPTVEIDNQTPPSGHIDLVVHEHDPSHGNYGIDALVSLRLTNAQAKRVAEELGWQSHENAAEVMLLDWMSDAEIGEALFLVLFQVDKVRKQLRDIMVAPHLTQRKARFDQMFADIQEGRRMLAAHLKWIDEVCKREGRPALADHEAGALEADGDTAA